MMHQWLVDHGWITEETGKVSQVFSYTAFFFILPCPIGALLESVIQKAGNSRNSKAAIGSSQGASHEYQIPASPDQSSNTANEQAR